MSQARPPREWTKLKKINDFINLKVQKKNSFFLEKEGRYLIDQLKGHVHWFYLCQRSFQKLLLVDLFEPIRDTFKSTVAAKGIEKMKHA